MKPRLVYLSSIASPHQVKFCNALQNYFDARFWFYESAARTRGKFWEVDLAPHCKVLENVHAPLHGLIGERYWAGGLEHQLNGLDPDIVMVGGFSIPANFVAYRWARRHGKRTIVFTERSRTRGGILRRRGLGWRMLRWQYRDVDLVMVSAEDAVAQFRDDFGFGEKVVAGRYATDLDQYFEHPIRQAKPAYTYLFANRLTSIYNPIGALEIFAETLRRYPGSRLLMNASGELRGECARRVAALGIDAQVEFLDSLRSWADLHPVYSRSDILLLPAHFSNGNFTILEAMASGMGLVVSNQVLGIGKMVRDGHNGFNCEPSREAFLDRIERYIAAPELFHTHAAANRPQVEPLGAAGTARFFSEVVRSRFRLALPSDTVGARI
jgi:glycosyltransferase involved in cell wall biosynthesis